MSLAWSNTLMILGQSQKPTPPRPHWFHWKLWWPYLLCRMYKVLPKGPGKPLHPPGLVTQCDKVCPVLVSPTGSVNDHRRNSLKYKSHQSFHRHVHCKSRSSMNSSLTNFCSKSYGVIVIGTTGSSPIQNVGYVQRPSTFVSQGSSPDARTNICIMRASMPIMVCFEGPGPLVAR